MNIEPSNKVNPYKFAHVNITHERKGKITLTVSGDNIKTEKFVINSDSKLNYHQERKLKLYFQELVTHGDFKVPTGKKLDFLLNEADPGGARIIVTEGSGKKSHQRVLDESKVGLKVLVKALDHLKTKERIPSGSTNIRPTYITR